MLMNVHPLRVQMETVGTLLTDGVVSASLDGLVITVIQVSHIALKNCAELCFIANVFNIFRLTYYFPF